jgi:hypothetical protein
MEEEEEEEINLNIWENVKSQFQQIFPTKTMTPTVKEVRPVNQKPKVHKIPRKTQGVTEK